MSTKIRNIFFIVGLVAIVIMLLTFEVSFKELWHQLTHAGYWLIPIIGMWLVLYCMNALTWKIIIHGSGPCPIPFLRILKVTISGFALNYATPVGLLGGEPYKIMEMKPYIGVQRASSSVLLFAMMHIFSHFWYWVTAVVLYLIFVPVTPVIGILLGLVILFAAGGIYLFVKGYKNGMVVKLIRFVSHIPGCRKWGHRFAETHAEDLQKIDQQIAQLHSQNKISFYASFFMEYFGRILQSFEIYFMLLLFVPDCNGDVLTFVYALLILAFTSLFANLLFFLPLQLGGREGGFAMSVGKLGMTGQVSMSISILCRVRELFWTAVGMLLIKVGNKGLQQLTTEAKELSDEPSGDIKFAILAAGEGSRLAQEGVEQPKPLVKIQGEAMIDRLIRIFMSCGAKEILIITNNLTPQTRQHLEDLQQKQQLPIRFIVKTTPSSMHSFYELSKLLGEGKFCLTTVDTIFREEEFKQYIDAFRSSSLDGMMAVTDYIDDEKPLYVSTDVHLRITGFHDSVENYEQSDAGKSGESECKYISGGIYCLTDKSFVTLQRCIEGGQSRMRNFQRQLVADGLHLQACPFSKILDVDHADDIVKAESFLQEQQ